MKKIRITTQGYRVAGCKHYYDAKQNIYTGVSGWLRVDKHDPSKDIYLRWDDADRAIDHNYGDLVKSTQVSVNDKSIIRASALYKQGIKNEKNTMRANWKL